MSHGDRPVYWQFAQVIFQEAQWAHLQGKGQELSMTCRLHPGTCVSLLQTGNAMQKQKLWISMCSAVLVLGIQSETQTGGRSHLSTTNSTVTAPWGFIAFRASGDGILDINSKLLLWIPQRDTIKWLPTISMYVEGWWKKDRKIRMHLIVGEKNKPPLQESKY